jgi:hypothetical protein
VPDLAHGFIQAQGFVDDVHLLIIDHVLDLGPLLHHDNETGAGMMGADVVQEPLVMRLLEVGNDEIVGALVQGLHGLGHGVYHFEVLITAEFDNGREKFPDPLLLIDHQNARPANGIFAHQGPPCRHHIIIY